MYNNEAMTKLIALIERYNGIADKEKLSDIVQNAFALVKDRKVYTGEYFSIRFSKSENRRMSNTVLSLSSLQKYDDKPFVVCIVSTATNYLLLANTTFLKKISHSSKELRIDNIKGSFNGGDIMYDFQMMENEPKNFQELYAFHEGFSFQDNLERLVEATNGIIGRVHKFNVDDKAKQNILSTVQLADVFVKSDCYDDLRRDLDERVSKVRGEIAIAAFINNVNLRGRIIEYLITDNGSTLKEQIMKALHDNKPLPKFTTEDKLGDYSKGYPAFSTETDIKTKVLFLEGNPKAYNIDKLLEFLATDKTVYMIYLIGIDDNGETFSRLCSIYDERLIKNTNVVHHWAGRNSRGVAQFIGSGLIQILEEEDKTFVSKKLAKTYLEQLIER